MTPRPLAGYAVGWLYYPTRARQYLLGPAHTDDHACRHCATPMIWHRGTALVCTICDGPGPSA